MSVSQPLLVESARSVRILHLISLTYLLMFVGYAAASGDDVPENFLADLANRGPMSPKKLFRGTNWTNYQAKFDKDVLTIKPKKASSVVLGNVLALLTFPTPSSSQPAPLYVMKFEGVMKSEKISKASCTTTLQFSQMVTGVTREDLGYFVVNLNHHLEKDKLLGVQESPSLNGSDRKGKKEGGNQTAFDFSFVIPNKNSKPVSMQVQFQFNDADANVKIDKWSITTFSDVLSKSPGPNLILNENWSLSCNRLLKEPDTRNVTKESIDDPKIMQFDLGSDKILNIVTQALDTIGMCTRVNYIGLQSSELSTVPAVGDAKGANTSQELALRILAPKRIPSTCFQEERTGILNVEIFVLNDWENVLYLKTFNIIWFASELEEGEEGEEASHASSSVVKSTFFLSQAESAKFQMYIRVSLSVPQPCNVNIGLHLAPAAQDAQINVQSFGRSKKSKKPKRGTALSGDLFVAPVAPVAPLDPSATMDPTLDDSTNDQLLPVKIEGLEESSSEEEWEDTDTEGNDPIIPKLLTPPKDPDDPGTPPAKSGSTMTVTIVIVVVVLGGVVAGIVWYVRTKRLRLRRFRAMNEGGDAEGEDMTAENARILVGDGEEEEDPEEPPEFDEEDVLNRCGKEISKCSINLYEQQTQELSDILFSPSKGKSDARRLSSFLDD